MLKSWGKPFAALLGALHAQQKLGIPAIGGKDSMSGTFKNISVPPTLVAFALTAVDVRIVISPEFKKSGHTVLLLPLRRDSSEMPDFSCIDKMYSGVYNAICKGSIVAAHTVRIGGIAEAIGKMSLGNRIGFSFAGSFDSSRLFSPDIGSLVVEINDGAVVEERFKNIDCVLLGSDH